MNVVLVLGMFPGFMSMIAIYFILKAMGLTNSLLALVLVALLKNVLCLPKNVCCVKLAQSTKTKHLLNLKKICLTK